MSHLPVSWTSSVSGPHRHHGGRGGPWGGWWGMPAAYADPLDPDVDLSPLGVAGYDAFKGGRTATSFSWGESNPQAERGIIIYGAQGGVGADPGTSKIGKLMTQRLDAAWAASSTASDSGSVVFAQHTGHKQAFADNRAAARAWKAVASLAGGYPKEQGAAENLEDAHARIGELDVAAQAIAFDAATHLTIRFGAKHKLMPPGYFHGTLRFVGVSSTPALLSEGGQAGAPASPARIGAVVAVVVGVGSKLLGWW